MTPTIHLWPEEHREDGDGIEVAAVLEGHRGRPKRLVFRLPIEHRASLSESTDPFVIGSTFHVLRAGADLEVHGTVSPSLLRGLEEFQAVWCRWKPELYRPFSVRAEAEREQERETTGGTIMPFSGGLDSCCTAWRHTRGGLGRRGRGVDAALMLNGFDIPLGQDEIFERALEKSKAILESIQVPILPMSCNLRILKGNWEHVHGAVLAACLHLLAGGFSRGLIASSHAYESLRMPWGSNPLTDPMLSSAGFEIVHDGCELTRWEKADLVADWEEARRHLRVCWEGEQLDRNCGACVGCVQTALCFAVMGRPIPPSIPISNPQEAVDRLRELDPSAVQLVHFENKVLRARRAGSREPWVTALAKVIRGHRRSRMRRGWGRSMSAWIRLRRRRKRGEPPQRVESRED